ncbi:glycosyl transferase [Lactococcus lactis]|uniref:glycosyl transferase n=1 Tax=Lactococcus lactis TaxID=1358 RepID=UPI00288FB856|nr:glycosyl transferase [Lactococcus lactis]MDT2872723.1 glycosyl transferase [Lactococcus lactis]
MGKIDFVVTYLDSEDKEWQKEKEKYAKINFGDELNSESRYRNMDNFQYWFRSIEKYAPWVNKIHLITWGHLPDWLNVENPKLNIVNHRDFMPSLSLPTFNSSALELNFDKIEGLSENFVYFNDDMFLNASVDEQDFFLDNKPVLNVRLRPIETDDDFMHLVLSNTIALNKLFKGKKLKISPLLNINNGINSLFFNLEFLPFVIKKKEIIGYQYGHLPYPLKKGTYSILQEYLEKEYQKTCCSKFRELDNITLWLLQDYYKASGYVSPSKISGKVIDLNSQGFERVLDSKIKMLCFNDNPKTKNFGIIKKILNNALQSKYPTKSSFEL